MGRGGNPWALLLVIASGVGTIACGPDLERTPLGEHVDFIFEIEGESLCAGSVAHLDRYIKQVFTFFGSPVPDDFVIPVRVVQDSPCSLGACYHHDGLVYAEMLDVKGRRPSGLLRHELTHAVIDHLWGSGVPFFAEGLAEVFSRTLASLQTPDPVLPVVEMLDKPAGELDYEEAARFVRFLIDTRGLARFKQVYQGAAIRSQSAIIALIEEVYGESFEAIEAEYLSGAPRCQYQLDLCDPLAAVEPLGRAWSSTFAATCLDPDFYGSMGQFGAIIATQRAIEVEFSGTYFLRVTGELRVFPDFGPKFSTVRFMRCGACDEQFVRRFDGGTFVVELEAGRYTLEFEPAGDSVVSIELEHIEDLP